MSAEAEVIVNGAGPVGLTMACEMARHGIAARVFDRNAEPVPESRALAIFPRTLEVFSTLGVLDEVLAEGQRLNGISLYNDSRRLAHLDFLEIDSPCQYVISLPQNRTERILQARIEALGGRVERCTELTGFEQDAEGVRASYATGDGTREEAAAWMIGCDGAHSTVRHLLGMNFQGEQYQEEFLLADVRVESDLPADEAHLFLSGKGVFAFFPFRDGRGRIIAAQRPGKLHAGLEPTMEEIEAIVRERVSHPLKLSDPRWRAWFRISHRMVEHYRSGRVFLAGDAAHVHSPAGGQGMNTGIQDAFNLGWKLALVLRGGASADLLESYEAERMPVARSVVNLTDRMTRAATARHAGSQQLRNVLVPFLGGIPFVKEAMAERLSEVAIDYRDSAWVENHGLGHVRAGDRAPDVAFFDPAARTERRLFELLRTPGFLLLIFESAEGEDGGSLGGLPGTVWRVARPGGETAAGSLVDRDCWARKSYGAGKEGLLVLIRPDGYVGFRGEHEAQLAAYVRRLAGVASAEEAEGPRGGFGRVGEPGTRTYS